MEKDVKRSLFETIRKDTSSYITSILGKVWLIYGYISILSVISTMIKKIVTERFAGSTPRVLLATENILVSNAFLLYGLLTNTYIVVISSKTMRSYNQISNIINLSGINIVIYDASEYWQSFFVTLKHKVALIDSEYLLANDKNINFVTLSFGEMLQVKEKDNPIGMSVMSSGSTSDEMLYHLPYDMVYEQMMNFTSFYKERTETTFAIIGKWNQLFGYFALFPLFYAHTGSYIKVGHRFYFYSEAQKLRNEISNFTFEFSVIMFSNELRKVWDHVLLEINKNKWVFKLNKYGWTKRILSFFTVRKLESFFHKRVKSIHIVNDDLGKDAKDVLKISKIEFTSSYGALETANFIAYKNNLLFTDSKYIMLSGGLLPSSTTNKYKYVLFNEDGGEEGILHLMSEDKTINTHDQCCYIDEVRYSETEEIFVCFLDKEGRSLSDMPAFSYGEEIRHGMRDSLLIRDIIIYKKDNNIYLLIEPRRELIDLQLLPYSSFIAFAKEVKEDLNQFLPMPIKAHAVLNFNRFRTESGRIALRLL